MPNLNILLNENESGFLISFFRLIKLLDINSKKKIVILAIISILTSVSEVLMIYIFMDFILYVQNQNNLDFSQLFLSTFLASNNPNQLIYILILITTLTTILRLFITWIGFRYQADIISKISKNLLEKINEFGYENRYLISDSEKVALLSAKINTLGNAITSIIAIVNGFFLGIGIFIGIFLKNSQNITFFCISILIIYYALSISTKKQLINNSKIVANAQTIKIDIIKRFTIGLRETILESLQDKFIQNFYNIEKKLRVKLGDNGFINSFPKFIIEATLIIVIALVAFFSLSKNESNLIAELGGIGLGTLRFIPCFQAVYVSIASIRGVSKSIFNVFEVLFDQRISPKIQDETIAYKAKQKKIIIDSLEARNIYYSYPYSEINIIEDCNLDIQKGDKVCIIGDNGSGKSTLMDILIGLIAPKKGTVLINNKDISEMENRKYLYAIRKQFSCISLENHIPNQNIFEYLNQKKIEDATSLQIQETKNALRESKFFKNYHISINDLKKLTGEECGNFSSGQKQRLILSRSISRKSEWLFLDEPTSSVDQKTSIEIIKMLIAKENLTLFLITHDLEIAKMFNIKYQLRNKKLKRIK